MFLNQAKDFMEIKAFQKDLLGARQYTGPHHRDTIDMGQRHINYVSVVRSKLDRSNVLMMVGDQIAVRKHHSLGEPCRSARVWQRNELLRVDDHGGRIGRMAGNNLIVEQDVGPAIRGLAADNNNNTDISKLWQSGIYHGQKL